MFKIVSKYTALRENNSIYKLHYLLPKNEYFMVITNQKEVMSLCEKLIKSSRAVQQFLISDGTILYIFNESRINSMPEHEITELHREYVWILEELDSTHTASEIIAILNSRGISFNKGSLDRITAGTAEGERLQKWILPGVELKMRGFELEQD